MVRFLDSAAIAAMRAVSPARVLDIADMVWADQETFLRWPDRPLLLLPGATRGSDGFAYPDEIRRLARAAGVRLDTRNNGPAITAFKLAGGHRPPKTGVRHGWSVHHIYDGLHPAPGRDSTSHSVRRGDLFTEAAGLVAAHPVADALASEVPFFAWTLRREAFLRFGLDPDGVFGVDARDGSPDEEPAPPGPGSKPGHSGSPPAGRGAAVAPPAAEPAVSYTSTRLHFKARLIEPLADHDVFEIQTPDATWRMTKADFYSAFPNVIASRSYAGERREYFYPKPPPSAGRFRV